MLQFVVVSRFPPPVGGVTVFAQRKVAELTRRGNRVEKIDFNNPTWALKLIRFAITQRHTCFLINTLNPLVLSAFWMLGLLDRCSVYDHNASRHYLKSSIKKLLLIFFSRRVGQMIVVHKRLQGFYNKYGVLTDIESPFLPPDVTRKEDVFNGYPKSLLDFIATTQHQVILNSAWRYVGDANGNDLYGVRCTLELLRRLIEMKISVRLVFAFGEFNRTKIPQDIQEEIHSLEQTGIIYLLDGQHELWPLFHHVDLFLRTTSTDGESVSVLESIYFECPVVASDVVSRPEGTITYEYENINQLTDIVAKSLAKKKLLTQICAK